MKPYYEHAGITIYHGDCREIAPALAADIVVTDPPYGDTNLPWDSIATGWVRRVASALPSTAAMWMFTSLRHLLACWPEFEGWRFAQDIVWEKHNGTNLMRDRFRRVHESAVHLYRGAWEDLYNSPPKAYQTTSRVVRKQSRPAQWLGATGPTTFVQPSGMTKLARSVMYCRSEHRRGQHPTQKPTSVVRPLVECSCAPDATVMDPFMGSGTTLFVAASLGRKAIGIEIEERYCEIAAKRLAQEVMDL